MDLKYIVKENDKNKTVKQVLKNEFKISNRLILKLKNNNKIFFCFLPFFIKKLYCAPGGCFLSMPLRKTFVKYQENNS